MTNFLFPKRRLIFIHIHKTGGSSIRKALGKRADRAGGYIPAHWPAYRRFAVVRHPIARFVSTINMFRYGREDFDDFFATGHFPDLTPTDALDILEDSEIPFDRRVRHPITSLKHHLLPQTHPYNCLQKADTILRFESLDAEFAAFCAAEGIEAPLAKLGASRKPEGALTEADLTGEDLARLWTTFRGDFEHLGYSAPQGIDGNLRLPPDQASDPWPGLRFHLIGKVISARDRLPDEDSPLRPFMEQFVTGKKGSTWAGRNADLTEHFLALEPEFHGRPRLAHLLACVIVVLRRDPTDATCRRLFDRIVTEFGADLASHLNLRWLTSVCDTFMDVSDDKTDRATALAGSLLANTIKLAETERRLFHPPQPEVPLYRFSRGGALFDGVISFWASKGDMMTNLLARAGAVLDQGGRAAPFTAEIIARVLAERTTWQRMMKLQGTDGPDLAPQELMDSLRHQLSRRDT